MFSAIINNEPVKETPKTIPAIIEETAVTLLRDQNINWGNMNLRSQTAINQRLLRDMRVAIIGVGGLGNHVVQQVAGMGFESIYVFDPDIVEVHNVGPQRHPMCFLGIPKVESAEIINVLTHGRKFAGKYQIKVENYNDILDFMGDVPDIIITAVDNMDFRNAFWASVRLPTPGLFIDMRMALGDWTVYAIPLAHETREYSVGVLGPIARAYASELFPQEQAVQEACTERAIIYTGANAASYVCSVLHWWASDGNRLSIFSGMEDLSSDFPVHYKLTFSSKDWEFITPSVKEARFLRKVSDLQTEIRNLERALDALKDEGPQPIPVPETPREPLPPLNINALVPGMRIRLDGEDETLAVISVTDSYAHVSIDGTSEEFNVTASVLSAGGEILWYPPNYASESEQDATWREWPVGVVLDDTYDDI